MEITDEYVESLGFLDSGSKHVIKEHLSRAQKIKEYNASPPLGSWEFKSAVERLAALNKNVSYHLVGDELNAACSNTNESMTLYLDSRFRRNELYTALAKTF